jgi:hypothetical protein
MARRSKDSVFDEPHMRRGTFRPDRSEQRVDAAIRAAPGSRNGDALKAERSVWDEPAVSPELAGGAPDEALTYERWLRREWNRVTPQRSWLVTAALALAAGPWAVLGALLGTSDNASVMGVLMVVAIAPVVEEMMKISAALWVAEKRPFLFRSPVQIVICGVAAGLVFGVVENLLYLLVYFPNASSTAVAWRWLGCTSVHVVCTLVASVGVVRVWRGVWERRDRARLTAAFPWMVAAMVLHGTYNGLALVASALGVFS